jgi:hypothetical protein
MVLDILIVVHKKYDLKRQHIVIYKKQKIRKRNANMALAISNLKHSHFI